MPHFTCKSCGNTVELIQINADSAVQCAACGKECSIVAPPSTGDVQASAAPQSAGSTLVRAAKCAIFYFPVALLTGVVVGLFMPELVFLVGILIGLAVRRYGQGRNVSFRVIASAFAFVAAAFSLRLVEVVAFFLAGTREWAHFSEYVGNFRGWWLVVGSKVLHDTYHLQICALAALLAFAVTTRRDRKMGVSKSRLARSVAAAAAIVGVAAFVWLHGWAWTGAFVGREGHSFTGTDAVQKISNETLLVTVAMYEPSSHVSQKAAMMLKDQVLLERVALHGDDWARLAAVAKLNNQQLLSRLVLHDADAQVRLAAVKNVNDQAVLAKIALTDAVHVRNKDYYNSEKYTSSRVRLAAVVKIADQAVLAKVALQDDAGDVVRAAISKVADQKVLSTVFFAWVGVDLEDIREAAVSNMTDEKVLRYVALGDPSDNVRVKAIAMVTSQDVLAKVVTSDESSHARAVAMSKLADILGLKGFESSVQVGTREISVRTPFRSEPQRRLIMVVALRAPDAQFRVAAIQNLNSDNEQWVLPRIALHDEEAEVRKAAIEALTGSHLRNNQKLLARISLEDKDFSVRWAAMEKLTDPSALSAVVANEKDSGFKRRAEERLKSLTASPK